MSFSSEYVKLCIKYDWGEATESVVDALMAKGSLTLSDLVRESEWGAMSVRKALLVLIQHDCVKVQYSAASSTSSAHSSSSSSSSSPESRLGVRVSYTLHPDGIRQRCLFPHFILLAKERFSLEGEYLLKVFTCHGQLRYSQLLQLAVKEILSVYRKRGGGIPQEEVEKALGETANQLYKQGYIMKASLLPQTAAELDARNSSSSTTSSSSSSSSSFVPYSSFEGIYLLSDLKKAMGVKRKRVEMEEQAAADAESGGKGAGRAKREKGLMKGGVNIMGEIEAENEGEEEEAYVNYSSTASSSSSIIESKEQEDISKDTSSIFALNPLCFLSHFRRQELIDYTLSRHSPTCAWIVKALANRSPIDWRQKAGGRGFTVRAILDMLDAERRVNTALPALNESSLQRELESLLNDPSSFLSRAFYSQTPHYSLSFTSFFRHIRLRHLQSLIKEKYSPLASRVFCLLSERNQLEESQIAEYAIAPRKNVRELLYELMRGGFISVQEIPKSNDRQPSRTFYCWNVNSVRAQIVMVESMYFSLCNLRRRVEEEKKKIKYIQEKVDMDKPLSEEERSNLERWKKSQECCETAANKITRIIAIFKEF